MARASYSVLRRFPKLAVLPMISGTVFLLVMGLILLSLLPQFELLYSFTGPIWEKFGTDGTGQVWFLVAAFAVIYALTVIAVFFNVALIHCALRCHARQEPSVRAGLAAATICLPQILGWALVAATVGVLLNAIGNVLRELGIVGGLIGGVLEFGWSVVTYFVLPVLAIERVGPITAIRRSSAILRSKWGESLAGDTRFGLLGILFILQAVALFFAGLAIQLSYGATAMVGVGTFLMAFGVVYGLATIIVLQALSTIFQAGVYLYATTGQVPTSLDPALVEGAFRPKS